MLPEYYQLRVGMMPGYRPRDALQAGTLTGEIRDYRCRSGRSGGCGDPARAGFGGEIILLGGEAEPLTRGWRYLISLPVRSMNPEPICVTQGHFESLSIQYVQDLVKALDVGIPQAHPEGRRQCGIRSPVDRLWFPILLNPDRRARPTGYSPLLDTGGRPEHCQYATAGSRVVLMGAGFIGSIIMEALVRRKVKLTLVEMADRMVPRMMDQTAGNLIKQWCIEQG